MRLTLRVHDQTICSTRFQFVHNEANHVCARQLLQLRKYLVTLVKLSVFVSYCNPKTLSSSSKSGVRRCYLVPQAALTAVPLVIV